jgi:hypothetical protein
MNKNSPQQSERMHIIKVVAAATVSAVLVVAGAIGIHALLGRVSKTDSSAINVSVEKPKEPKAVSPPKPRPLPLRILAADNAIRYPEGELASYAKDYVYNESGRESRVYVEFDLRSLSTPPDYAELVFSVDPRHLKPNLPDQAIHVYGYKGDGTIRLDDWQTEGTYLGLVGPFVELDDRGWKQFRLDVTGLLSGTLAAKIKHVGFYVRSPGATKGILKVGGFHITFPDKP